MKTYVIYKHTNKGLMLCALCNKKKPLLKAIAEQEKPDEYSVEPVNLSKQAIFIDIDNAVGEFEKV